MSLALEALLIGVNGVHCEKRYVNVQYNNWDRLDYAKCQLEQKGHQLASIPQIIRSVTRDGWLSHAHQHSMVLNPTNTFTKGYNSWQQIQH